VRFFSIENQDDICSFISGILEEIWLYEHDQVIQAFKFIVILIPNHPWCNKVQ